MCTKCRILVDAGCGSNVKVTKMARWNQHSDVHNIPLQNIRLFIQIGRGLNS